VRSVVTSVGFDLLAALLCGWLVAGSYVDGWAHRHHPDLETFFTPWHALLYSGFLAARGVVLLDNVRIHTPNGANAVREAVAPHGDRLRLVPAPAYDPQANPAKRLFSPFRRAVTHDHHRDNVVDLFRDAHPERALRHIGSPFALADGIVPTGAG
jgi:hypothetical protein